MGSWEEVGQMTLLMGVWAGTGKAEGREGLFMLGVRTGCVALGSRHKALHKELEREREASKFMAQVAAHEWARNQEQQRQLAMAAKDTRIASPGQSMRRNHSGGSPPRRKTASTSPSLSPRRLRCTGSMPAKSPLSKSQDHGFCMTTLGTPRELPLGPWGGDSTDSIGPLGPDAQLPMEELSLGPSAVPTERTTERGFRLSGSLIGVTGGDEKGRLDPEKVESMEQVEGMERELGLVRLHVEEVQERQREKLAELRQLREELEACRVELKSSHVVEHKARTLQVCLEIAASSRAKAMEEAEALQGELLKAKQALTKNEQGGNAMKGENLLLRRYIWALCFQFIREMYDSNQSNE